MKPERKLALPPLPRSVYVQQVCTLLEQIPADDMEQVWDYYEAVYQAAGNGTAGPLKPLALTKLPKIAQILIHDTIPTAFKSANFQVGFSRVPEEVQAQIIKAQRKEMEAAEEEKRLSELYYAHLAADGIDLTNEDGSITHFTNKEAREMVDCGMLPPNPDANIPCRKPTFDMTGKVMKVDKMAGGIAQPLTKKIYIP